MVRSAVLALALAVFPAAASACLVCIDVPDESLADRAIAAEAVALLRPSPDDPFRYVPVTFLKGGPDLPPVPFLVSRPAAAALVADPTAATVGLFSAAEGWSLHDQGTEALGDALREAIRTDLGTAEARLAFFGPLVANPDPAVQQMALIELATLPYPVLRQVQAHPSRREVAGRAFDPLWAQWAPVMILLLGTSDDPEDARFVRAAVDRLAASGHGTHLSAWATALIEVDGVAAIETLKRGFVDRPDASAETVRAVVVAMAEHSARSDAVGDAALAALVATGNSQPGEIGYVARALQDRMDWSQADNLAALRDAGRIADPVDDFVVGQYIAAAEYAAASLP